MKDAIMCSNHSVRKVQGERILKNVEKQHNYMRSQQQRNTSNEQEDGLDDDSE
jgi:hypothetical protein